MCLENLFCLPIFYIIQMREICLLFFYNVFRKQCYLLTHDGNNTCNEGLKIMNGFFLFVVFFSLLSFAQSLQKKVFKRPEHDFLRPHCAKRSTTGIVAQSAKI